MARNAQKHLTASGKLKPSVRLALRTLGKDCGKPTYLSADYFNGVQESLVQLIHQAGNADKAKAPSAQPELLKPSRKAWNYRLFIWNVGLDIAMFFAVKHRCKTLWLKLKKSFYAGSYAVCTQVYRLVRRIERMLGAIHDGSLSVPMQFVLVKVSRFFLHLSQFLFEVTFAIGHRRMLLLEREALALDVHQAFVHVADDLNN